MTDSNGVAIPNKPSRQIQFTVQQRRSYVKSFETSDQTMTAYCEKHGIPISTFSAWCAKYSKRKSAAFVPVQINSKSSSVLSDKSASEPTKSIEIHRGDLKVVLPMIDTAMTVEIIKGVLACN